MPGNPDPTIYKVWTDANSYLTGSTSVDIKCLYHGGGGTFAGCSASNPSFRVRCYLQRKSGDSFVQEAMATTNVTGLSPGIAKISLSGVPNGIYRVGTIWDLPAQCGTSRQNKEFTYTFTINR